MKGILWGIPWSSTTMWGVTNLLLSSCSFPTQRNRKHPKMIVVFPKNAHYKNLYGSSRTAEKLQFSPRNRAEFPTFQEGARIHKVFET